MFFLSAKSSGVLARAQKRKNNLPATRAVKSRKISVYTGVVVLGISAVMSAMIYFELLTPGMAWYVYK